LEETRTGQAKAMPSKRKKKRRKKLRPDDQFRLGDGKNSWGGGGERGLEEWKKGEKVHSKRTEGTRNPKGLLCEGVQHRETGPTEGGEGAV